MADRREGVSVYYRINHTPDDRALESLWKLLRQDLNDALVQEDSDQLALVLAQRASGRNWPDSVAGDMERHYSPGRTWEATARALVHLLDPGHVLDIASGDGVMGELLARQATYIDCIDLSPKVVAAGSQRVANFPNVAFHQGDMHVLPFESARFDTVLMLHALTFSGQPEQAIKEAVRVMKPGARLIVATLKAHRYQAEVRSYGHVNTGFSTRQLKTWCRNAGLDVSFCDVTSIEQRTPHFRIITLLARRGQSTQTPQRITS